MKILITGANGMLAHDIIEEFKDNNELILAGKDLLDITDKDNINNFILQNKPDVLINTSAYTAVDKAEDEDQKELCSSINTDGVKYLAEICAQNNIIFIHYSTDYIFDGNNKNGYTENDITLGSVNYYGQSKYLGEQNILKVAKEYNNFIYYIIRISWLYGKEGKNFVKTMLSLSETKSEIKVINDQFGSPTYTVDVAKITKYILNKKLEKGIYHATNEGYTTWYEFTKEIFRLKNINTLVLPVTSNEYITKAKRPRYSMLINTKIEPRMRNWKEALEEFLKAI